MSIQSTIEITRKEAIERINLISKLANEEKFLDIDRITLEDIPPINIRTYIKIESYTNKMLEDIMDSPFYRRKKFDNYSIVE